MICESWSRLLDPFWEQAKQEVRDSFAYEDLPKGYNAIQAILQKLENDAHHADEVHQKMAVPKVIDYVVVHELCHMHVRDHSEAFWNEVDKILPDYMERKNWLRQHGAALDI
jgi:hypothetical protein